MKKLIANQFRKTGAIAGGYMGLFGFIADILSPIAPFSSYLFFASAFMVVFFLIIMVVKSTLQEKIAPALVVSITLLVISGSLYAVQEEPEMGSTNYGVLATQIPALQSLQSSLGLIQEDVAAIRKSTENIDQTTARTEQVVKQVEINTKETTEATKKVADAVVESTKQIVGSLEEMQKGFTSLTQAGGVIANPTRPEQFYHNARIQELGGDYGNARQSYNKYFTFKLDFLDPHLRYQSFLKIQEGKAGAREIYSYLYENDPRPIVEYARILLFDAPKRTQMLEEFIKSNPDFAPAYYELSLEYSQARKGTQSLSDKKAEYKALEQFNALTKEGKLFKYFVDKETVSKWVDDAEQRFRLLSLKRDGKWTEWYENGQKKTEGYNKEYQNEGKWIWWYDNGQKSEERNYKDGKNDGKWTEWNKNGQIKFDENYKDGKKVGETKHSYYTNGQKSEETNYIDGKLDGKMTLWYENGQKNIERNFKDDKQDGKMYEWWENGENKTEGTYKDDKWDGKWTYWCPNFISRCTTYGKIAFERIYKNGVCISDTQYSSGGC